MDISKVAVIGAGTMGHGIAQVVSTAGISTGLYDIKTDYLDRARTRIIESLNRQAQKGKIDRQQLEDIISRIGFSTGLQAVVEGADLIIEAVPENLELKKELFKKLDGISKPQAILASNTSQYSITEIASVASDPSRVIGMHWFNPPVMMKLVEIVKGLETKAEVVDTIRQFAEKLGKETVVCRDSQGFISTRLLVALRLECYRVLEEGIATKEDIDKTLRLAFGHPMGQFELADFSGLDIEVPICEGLCKIYGDRFRPTQNLLNVVRAGRYGRKSGKGWYQY